MYKLYKQWPQDIKTTFNKHNMLRVNLTNNGIHIGTQICTLALYSDEQLHANKRIITYLNINTCILYYVQVHTRTYKESTRDA